jgi:hypothetical protein
MEYKERESDFYCSAEVVKIEEPTKGDDTRQWYDLSISHTYIHTYIIQDLNLSQGNV